MIVFFGTSPRSARFLEQAVQNGLKVDLVVSEPPKPTGKKQILTENPTVTIAKKLGIPHLTSIFNLLQPSSIFHHQSSNIGLILDFNQIIPNDIIDLFPKGIINIHFSKLPQYRGPAPVQYTILNGHKEAGVTYYVISEKVDAGLILKQTSLTLDMTETTEDLYQKLIAKSVSEIKEILDYYLEGKITPSPQIGTPSLTHKLTTQNCQIDWTKSPVEIDRLIRAAYPEPIAWTTVKLPKKNITIQQFNNITIDSDSFEIHRLKVHKAHLDQGQLILDQVQLEGKNPVSWKQFQQGYPEAGIIKQFNNLAI